MVMYNFSEFCKEKKCEHYKEWAVQAGKEGMVRCCELVGMSFYVTTFPDNCIHFDEITERKRLEREKHDAWKKLSDAQTPSQKLKDRMNQWGGLPKKYNGYKRL